jgi:tRNA(Ile)-lysidine synthase
MPKRSAPDAERPFSDDEVTDLFAPLGAAPHIALAVSGGSDSTALLFLAARWRRLQSIAATISVLTVDHALRPGSAAEAATVAAWAQAEGFAHHMLVWDGPKPNTGVQAAARAERYRLMTEWCRGHGASCLLTAHTQEDQAETVLMRLARGSGIDGLAGIYRQMREPGVVIHRPLLGETRARLRAFLTTAGRRWIEDPSNAMLQFERVRLRRHMPELAALGLTAEAISRTAARALDASQALWAYAADFIAASAQQHDAGYADVDREAFFNLPDETKRRVILLLVNRYGGCHREQISLSAAERLTQIESWTQPARTFGGCKFVRRKRSLLVGRESGRIDVKPLVIPAEGQVLWDGRFQVYGPPGHCVIPAVAASGLRRDPDLPKFVHDSLPAVLDAQGWAQIPQFGGADGVRAVFVPHPIR